LFLLTTLGEWMKNVAKQHPAAVVERAQVGPLLCEFLREAHPPLAATLSEKEAVSGGKTPGGQNPR